jgi:hypothetical protein
MVSQPGAGIAHATGYKGLSDDAKAGGVGNIGSMGHKPMELNDQWFRRLRWKS